MSKDEMWAALRFTPVSFIICLALGVVFAMGIGLRAEYLRVNDPEQWKQIPPIFGGYGYDENTRPDSR
jgi:hypothetical protein